MYDSTCWIVPLKVSFVVTGHFFLVFTAASGLHCFNRGFIQHFENFSNGACSLSCTQEKKILGDCIS